MQSRPKGWFEPIKGRRSFGGKRAALNRHGDPPLHQDAGRASLFVLIGAERLSRRCGLWVVENLKAPDTSEASDASETSEASEGPALTGHCSLCQCLRRNAERIASKRHHCL